MQTWILEIYHGWKKEVDFFSRFLKFKCSWVCDRLDGGTVDNMARPFILHVTNTQGCCYGCDKYDVQCMCHMHVSSQEYFQVFPLVL